MAYLEIHTKSGFTFNITGNQDLTTDRANRMADLIQDLAREHTLDRYDAKRVVRFKDLGAPEIIIALDHVVAVEVHLAGSPAFTH